MTDDRYTVDDPPEEGEDVWIARAYRQDAQYSVWSHGGFLLENRCLHRTEESAQAHARRMVMADEILEALEAMVLAVGRPGTAQNLAVLGANRVIARARGEVAG
jgi:uracil DNA glycosylase